MITVTNVRKYIHYKNLDTAVSVFYQTKYRHDTSHFVPTQPIVRSTRTYQKPSDGHHIPRQRWHLVGIAWWRKTTVGQKSSWLVAQLEMKTYFLSTTLTVLTTNKNMLNITGI